MKVLVTGSNGMIGRAVLAAPPATVTALHAQVGPGPVAPGGPADGFPTVTCDITDHDALRPLAEGVDAVIHLAGPPSVAASFADPVEFLRAHVLGTATVVQLCQDLGIGRLVHVSSAEVYGRPSRNPVDEAEPLTPRSPYAAAKVGAESAIGAAARSSALDAVVLRPFSVYGPGIRRDSVLGVILDQALAGDTIRLQRLDSIRDHCYVGDLAVAIWRAATTEVDGLLTCNIGSGVGTSSGDLARAALAARDGTVPDGATVEAIGSDGARPASADITELVADIGLARDALGWEPATELVDGLARTLDWYATTMAPR